MATGTPGNQSPRYEPMGPHTDGCKPVSLEDMAREELVLLRQMVANQKQIIELLRDISIGLA